MSAVAGSLVYVVSDSPLGSVACACVELLSYVVCAEGLRSLDAGLSCVYVLLPFFDLRLRLIGTGFPAVVS